MTNDVLVRLEWESAAALVNQAHKIILITHVFPDGDAIGSLMGLTLALKEQGKMVCPVVDGGLPERFSFVPGSEMVQPSADGFVADLVITTDASDWERLGENGVAARQQGCPILQLDHHQTNLMFADVNLVDARTVAASEGVLDWLDQLGWQPSQQVAQALLTGIVTDTLCFRTSNVQPATLGKAQRLLEYGADLAGIVQRTLSRQPASLIRLYGEVLSRVQIDSGVIWLALTEDDYQRVGMSSGEYDGLSGYLIQVEEAVISCVLKPMGNNQVEISLRAVPGFDVSQIALSLGGGGHVLASGATLKEVTMDETIAKVLPLLQAESARGRRLYD